MALRFRPVDGTFYDLFTRSATDLIGGAALLAEMLADGADRPTVAKQMREAEHSCRRDDPRDRAAGQHHVRHAVRP